MKKLLSTNRLNGFIFVIAMWLFSRLLIVAAMKFLAPLVPSFVIQLDPHPVPGFTPTFGWDTFSHWDGGGYLEIATLGYDNVDDPQPHNIVWFPLFPLVIYGVMTLGFPPEVAGILVNNLAFLGALGLLYSWVEERHNLSAARWATAVLAWSPLSLFGTVIYTEGLFLLLTTAALRAFDKRQHARAALWGAMATATRVTGAALVPAFLLVAWREQRPAIAYAAGLAASGGLVLFSIYCAIRYGDPLAFVHSQQWWLDNSTVLIGLRRFINIVMILGSGYLLWRLSTKLSRVAVAYGFSTLALIIISKALTSVNRFLYGNVSLSLALGVLFARYPRWGYLIISIFAILLVVFSIRFSWNLWVA